MSEGCFWLLMRTPETSFVIRGFGVRCPPGARFVLTLRPFLGDARGHVSLLAKNYPFCTIEPNIGRVAIPDARLDTLAKIAGSKKIIGAQLEFVDIAGLVRGASEGAGLGNKFLGNIRQVSMILMRTCRPSLRT
jgi:50S ribosome-binding GTPase